MLFHWQFAVQVYTEIPDDGGQLDRGGADLDETVPVGQLRPRSDPDTKPV